ncbi:hypothetical protein [Alteromonas sp. KUL106]|uniref:hypothetical protein n=1 Tax=Alteromonas sp. KUL106 TaxID=2480799 RepID=UPI0012E4A799|nr:hypothetical protein [Alteromonas sp. KUL106]GFD70366.1 hypothetical protein KUL106_36290 [Alteromonas sp. KUL106]
MEPKYFKLKLQGTSTGFDGLANVSGIQIDEEQLPYGPLELDLSNSGIPDDHPTRKFKHAFYVQHHTTQQYVSKVVITVPAGEFLWEYANADIYLPVELRFTKSTWQWRLLKSAPDNNGKNLLWEFADQLRDLIGSSDSGKVPFLEIPDLDAVRIVGGSMLPGSGSEQEWRAVKMDEPKDYGITLQTLNGWVGIRTPDGGLRINLSTVQVSRYDIGKCKITLKEEDKHRTHPESSVKVRFKLDFNGEENEVRKEAMISNVELANGRQKTISMDVGWSHTDEDQASPSDQASGSPSLWIGAQQTWLNLTNPVNNIVLGTESRRWHLSAALSAFDDIAIHCLLDQAGEKQLELKFDQSGGLVSAELIITDPVFEFACDKVSVISSDALASPNHPPCLAIGETERLRFLAKVVTKNESDMIKFRVKDKTPMLELHPLNADSALHYNQLWLKPGFPVVAPLEWAVNDLQSNRSVSSLRALVPVEAPCWLDLSKGLPEWHLNADKAKFPNNIVGSTFLPLTQYSTIGQCLEWRIVSNSEIVVLERFANPHLDQQFGATLINKKGSDAKSNIAPEHVAIQKRYVVDPSQTMLGIQDFIENNSFEYEPTELGDNEVTSISYSYDQTRNNVFFTCQVLKDGDDSLRSSVLLRQQLEEGLKEVALSLKPIAVTNKKTVRFQLLGLGATSESLLPFHSALQGKVINIPIDIGDNAIDLDGSASLPAQWLHDQVLSPDQALNFEGFKGIESRNITLEPSEINRTLTLKKLVYWFQIEGVAFSIQSEDKLTIYLGDEPNRPLLEGPSGNYAMIHLNETKDQLVFVKIHKLAPELLAEEHLLPKRKLILRQSDPQLNLWENSQQHKHLTFAISKYGYDLPDQDNAYFQAGVYHVAWANECYRGDIKTPLNGTGIVLGGLTRIFMRLERDVESGDLVVAEGMVGWRCPTLPGGFENTGRARATFYARKSKGWHILRLSGNWHHNQQDVEVALVRHSFNIKWSHDSGICNIQNPSEDVWGIVGRGPLTKRVFAYQTIGLTNNDVEFGGKVKTHELESKPINLVEVRSLPTNITRPAVSFGVVDSYTLRWSLKDKNDLREWIDPIAILEDFNALRDDLLPGNSIAPAGTAHCKWGDTEYEIAVTESEEHGDLLCPVVKIEEPGKSVDQRAKIWLFTEKEGDEMAVPPGFVEFANQKDDQAAMVRTAEQILAYIGWRKPAILETWVDENDEQDNKKSTGPRWSLIDPPLLNIHTSLEYFTTAIASGYSEPIHRDSALVPLSDEMNIGSVEQATLEILENESEKSRSSIPAKLEATHSLKGVNVRRWIPFDVNQLREQFPGSPWPSWTEIPLNPDSKPFRTVSNTTSICVDFASPRPGELMGISLESANGNQIAGMISRSQRSRAVVEINSKVDTSNGVTWWVEPPIPKLSLPQVLEPPVFALLAGRPGAIKLRVNESWPLRWIANGDLDASNLRVVVRIEALSGEEPGEIEVKYGDDVFIKPITPSSKQYLVLPPSSHGEILYIRLMQTSEKDAEWNIVFDVHAIDQPSNEFEIRVGEQVASPNPDHQVANQLNEPFNLVNSSKADDMPLRRPHTVAILSSNRLMAYGPWQMAYTPQLAEDNNSIFWRAESQWNEKILEKYEILCIAPDGSESWSDAILQD